MTPAAAVGRAKAGLTFGSLFTGIGGLDLGLERAGMVCKWQVEIDPFCTKVLEKHWPEVKRYGDIRGLDGAELERVDLITGGFPCQDVSQVGARKGIGGIRSGLWLDMARIIRLVRPRFVLVENVSGLFNRGFGAVVGGLAEIGYDAEWSSISACSMGASHTRERVFILAYPTSDDHKPAGQSEMDMVKRWLNGEPVKNTYIRLRSLLAARSGKRLPANPNWIEWLMGYPIGYTALKPSETPLSRKSLSGSANKL